MDKRTKPQRVSLKDFHGRQKLHPNLEMVKKENILGRVYTDSRIFISCLTQ